MLPSFMHATDARSGASLRSPVVQTLFGTAIAFVIWYYSSKAVHDLLVWGAFAAALPRARRAWPVWRNPAGIAFLVILVFAIATLPLSVAPADSLRDMLRMARLPAGAFALSVWFNRPARLFNGLLYSALAITLVLAADLIRLFWVLRGDVLVAAHAHKPFALNHSNVSSMLAGLCFFVFAALPAMRKDRAYRITAAAGILICALYLYVLASRGPQIAFLGTLATAGCLWIPGWRARLAWIIVGLLAAGFAGMHLERINPRFADREEITTFAGRTTVWQHTWELAQQRPWRGYGFGKRVFQSVYAATDPPPSPFFYPHPHSYGLFALFQHGWPGLGLYALAWGLLAWQLAMRWWRDRKHPARWLTGLTALLLLMLHLYGLIDYPDNRLALALAWLIPAALIKGETTC